MSLGFPLGADSGWLKARPKAGIVSAMGTVIVIAVVVLAVVFGTVVFNSLIRLRNRTDNAWSQMEVQLKRRYDLIPNLVETVKGYASHEQDTLEAVVAARNRAVSASSVADQGEAENMLTGALRQLFALAENYPDLRASEQFGQLQGELTETENKIAVARQIYNDTVLTYNNKVETIPSNLVAALANFSTRPYFEVDTEAGDAPDISF
jgi:LemA protein